MQSTDAFVQAIMRWHKNNNRPLPWRKDVTPYRTLVAEVMLQRTTAKLAANHFEKVIEAYPDIRSLARADDAELNAMLQPIGMPKRATTLKQSACQILEKHDGNVPSDTAALLRLPGVGNYTAAAIQIVGFSMPAAPIDTNVARIVTRYFGARKSGSVERITRSIFARKKPADLLYAIMDFSALVCCKRNPQHEHCPVRDGCKFMREVCSRHNQ